MDISQRLKSLESNLLCKERVLARFKTAQARGGFFDYCEAALEPFAIEDREAAFFFHLVNQCNGAVLELLALPIMQMLAICMVCLARSEQVKANEAELSGIRVLLHNFVVESLALESAIEQTCQENFGGIDILFSDLKQKLAERNQHAKTLLQGYSAIGPNQEWESVRTDWLTLRPLGDESAEAPQGSSGQSAVASG